MEDDEELMNMIVQAMEQSLANIRCERPLKITNEQIQNIIDELFEEMRRSTSKRK